MEKPSMFKQILVGGSLCAGLWMVASPAQAQSSAPASPAPASPAPAEPAPTAPVDREVSETEVEKFASAIKQLRTIQEEAEQQASQIFEAEQISGERFSQILQSQRNPEAQPTPEVSEQEQQQFQRVSSKLEELRQSTRQRFDQVFQAEQLPRERFAQILSMAQQDASLRQRIEQELQN
jgi:hypothetical protein